MISATVCQIGLALGEQSGDLRQSGVQGLGLADHLVGGHHGLVHRRRHLGARPGEPGDQRIPGVVRRCALGFAGAMPQQRGDGCHPSRDEDGLLTLAVLDLSDQNVRPRRLEHTFDSATVY
jgi:hypothetical protein